MVMRVAVVAVLAAMMPAWLPSLKAAEWDVGSDTWVATDALGRNLPDYRDCGPPRTDRYVGIFYFLWLGQHGTGGPYDITKLLAANPTNPQWGPQYAFHHWGESELGYYLSDDPYVIRRHCHLLTDAGVDTLIFDVTNAFTYKSNYLLLCSVYTQIRAEGGRTPQICFLANSSGAATVQQIYNDLYSKNLYPDLWFRWQGKPLMLAPPDGLSEEIRNFFTLRQSWAWSGTTWFGSGYDKWPWLDHYPQAFGWHTPGVPEEMPVCVAEHPTTNIGRSHYNGVQPEPADQHPEQGLFFGQQIQRALQVDPEFIFITGWNEWVAQRFLSDGTSTFLGRTLPAGETYFVDEYNQEYSRDIEPMKGGHTDNYYYQMVELIRRFKGVRPRPYTGPQTAITIDGVFTDWAEVSPEFRDNIADTVARNHAGWGSAGTYVNNTGRNDIIAAKVMHDADYVYFHARTQANLTSRTGQHWMLLFIDADADKSTGWEGYDYLVNYPVVSSTQTSLKRYQQGSWVSVVNVPFRMSGKQLEIRIARADLGKAGGADLSLDFHWADNIQVLNDISEFGINGDSAPDRRFNYRYVADFTPPGTPIGLTATRDGNHVDLAWINPSDADVAGVVIRCRIDDYPAGPTDGDLVCDQAGSAGGSGNCAHDGLSRGTRYFYAAFAYDGVPHHGAAARTDVYVPAPGDFDADGDVDQSDFGLLQTCFSGNGIPVTAPTCSETDLDFDMDVDSADCRAFTKCLSGGDVPADPQCAK